jgi:hypothetical protein
VDGDGGRRALHVCFPSARSSEGSRTLQRRRMPTRGGTFRRDR